MLDSVMGGIARFGQGYGQKDYRTGGYGYQEHKEFRTHVESEAGYFDRQARYDHRMKLPGNHGRPPMSVMPVCDEEDSDVEEFFESSQSHHSSTFPHGNGHGIQGHGKLGMQHHDMHGMQNHGKHGMQHHDMHGMQNHGKHGMQHHDMHGMQNYGKHGKQHYGELGMKHHGEHGMQHHDMYGMQQQGAHGMQHQSGHGMKHHDMYGMQHQSAHGMKHQDRLMAPQVAPPHHVYISPTHGSNGHAVVVQATENWRVSNTARKTGWGSKGL